MKILKKIDYNSPIILSFALVSFVALLLGYITGGKSTQVLFCVYRSSAANPLTYIRLFGHVLGHADLSHYINNMMMLLLVGPMLEEKYGSKLLFLMILITAFLTGLFNIMLFPNTALLGASGVVFMMIILSSVTSVKEGTIPLTLIVVVILYLGQQIMAGLFTPDNISQFTHILGGILGGVFGLVIKKNTENP
ncbi:MAG: rhomboid family intramembrane serine protease [Lachnospiraceae bacterium]|nr:rhomboid family intramembrane serine protease [Lachnospiraceae bacterium]